MSLTRTLSRKVAFALTETQYANDGSGHIVLKTTSNRTLTGNGSATYGDNYKDWKFRIRNHMSATTTLTATSTLHITMTQGTISTKYTYPYTILFATGDIFINHIAIPTVSTSLDLVADRKASSNFLKNYIKLTNTWRGGNFIAELRETIHMLRNPVKSFYMHTWKFTEDLKRFKGFRRKRARHRIDFVDYLSDAWLAFSFGVKPLIADANDAAAALNKFKGLGGTGHKAQMLSGYGDNKTVVKNVGLLLSLVAGFSDMNNFYDAYTVSHGTVRYRAAIKTRLEDSTTLLNQFGVGVFDVVPAAWEAIPWSFFIDYFANVGEMIDSCRLCAADVAWCNRTIRNSTAQTRRDVRHVPTPSIPTVSILGNPSCFTLARYVNRVPSGIPFPSWRFQVPGIDSMKWLNIAALTNQIASSRPTYLGGKRYS